MAFNETNPAKKAVSITPNDSTDLTSPTRAFYVGVDGDAKVTFEGDTTAVTLLNLVAGVVYPFKLSRVWSTGTTGGAGDYIGLY